MVSLWPWKRDQDSTSTFEKTLSTLSTKITRANASKDSLRSRFRRLKVLWTVYTGFAYILCALILTLVTGWAEWGSVEYAVIFGSPFIIYGVRTVLSAYYNYRLASTEAYLEQLQSQRDEAIETLKIATKYNSTQQLLEKYGAAPNTPPSTKYSRISSSPVVENDTSKTQQVGRTGILPPPTANIPRPVDSSDAGSTPQQHKIQRLQQVTLDTSKSSAAFGEVDTERTMRPGYGEEFAPNAHTDISQCNKLNKSTWFDRLVDILLGEDETRPINRLALICHDCKLVNGQAPPGAKSLEDVGKWRCMNCRAWNGKENQIEKMILAASQVATQHQPASPALSTNSDPLSPITRNPLLRDSLGDEYLQENSNQ